MQMQHITGAAPAAIMRNEADVPMVKIGPGISVQLLQVDFDHNIRVTRALLEPGVKLRKHAHTGFVHAWTLSGSWKYMEYPEVNVANSYLYEPAGSAHTLLVPPESKVAADVIFIVHGSNIEYDEDGNFHCVTDAAAIAGAYLQACRELGLPRPNVIGLPDGWEA